MLRRGRHIGRDDTTIYEYLIDAQAILEDFYRRFGCELVQKSDGYFYLLPSNDRLGKRHLSAGEMLIGQTLALLYLDPETLQHAGIVKRESILIRLSGLLGEETLVRILSPRRRRHDKRIDAKTVRDQAAESLRRLEELGFVDIIEDDRLRLRPALMRFAEPVRGIDDLSSALERLIIKGEVLLEDSTGDESVEEADHPHERERGS